MLDFRKQKKLRNFLFFGIHIMSIGAVLAPFLFLIAFETYAATGINPQITYQARITNTSGSIVSNGTYYAKFVIYDASSGGSCLWTAVGACDTSDFGTTTVSVTNGIFTATLGGSGHNSLATSSLNFNSDSLYLGVSIRGTAASPQYDDEMTPRRRLAASPYAFNSDAVDGISAASSATASQLLALDANKVFNLAEGSVSSTAATSSAYLSIGSSNNVSNINYAGGDLYVADTLEADGLSFFNRASTTQATTTDYLWVGGFGTMPSGFNLQGGDLYVADSLFTGGRATTTGSFTAGATLYVQSDTNLAGVGTTTPFARLSIQGSTNAPIFAAADSNQATNFFIGPKGHAAFQTTTFQDAFGLTVATTTRFANNVTFASTLSINGITYTFPGSQGSNTFLRTDGAGTLTWAVAPSSQSWELAFPNALTPTSSSAGIFVRASSTFNSSLRLNDKLIINAVTPTDTYGLTVATTTIFTQNVTLDGVTTLSDARITSLNASTTDITTLTVESTLQGAGFTTAFDNRLNATTTLDLTTLQVGTLTVDTTLSGTGFTSAFDTRLNATTTLDLTTLQVNTLTVDTTLSGTGFTTAFDDRLNATTTLDLTTLQVGNLSSSNVTITGGSITGITDLTVSDGGTGASTLGSGQILLGAGTSPITSTSTLSVVVGGTGAASFTNFGIIYGGGTSPLGATAAGSSNQVLVSGGGVSAPTWASLTALQGNQSWQLLFADAITPTSSSAGIFVRASSTFDSHLRINGNATTSQNLTVLGKFSLGSTAQPYNTTTQKIQDRYTFGDQTAAGILIREPSTSVSTSGLGPDSEYYGIRVQDTPSIASTTYGLYLAGGGQFKQEAGQIKLKGSIGDDGSTELDGAMDIAVLGQYAYVAGNVDDGFEILDISNPSSPAHISAITDDSTTLLDGAARIKIQGRYAYVTSNSGSAPGLEILDITNPSAPIHVSSLGDTIYTLLDGATGIDVQGHYAYITSVIDDAIEIIDIADPTLPKHVSSIADSATTELNGAYDVLVRGKYAYVTGRDDNGIEILNVSDASNPVHVGALTDDVTTLLTTPKNLEVSGKYAYVVSSGGLEIIDIKNPESPTHTGSLADSAPIGLSDAHDLEILGNYAYITATADDAIEIVDISDPTTPRHVAVFFDANTTAKIVSSASGANGIASQGRYLYVTGYDDDGMSIFEISGAEFPAANIGSLSVSDISVWNDINIAKSLNVGTGLSVGPGGIVSQGPIGANGSISIVGNASSTGEQFLKASGSIIDDATTELATAHGIDIQGRYAYVTGLSDSGVEILDISSPTGTPVHVGSITDDGTTLLSGPRGIVVNGRYAYVAGSGSDDGVEILDVSNPTSPVHIGKIDETTDSTNFELSDAYSLEIQGRYLYVASYVDDGLEIVDISDPSNPRHVGALTDAGSMELDGAYDISIQGRYVYIVSDLDNGLEIIDVSLASNPVHVGALNDDATTELNGALALDVLGKYAYIAGYGDDGIEIVNISNPSSPVHVGDLEDDSSRRLDEPIDIAVHYPYAYVPTYSDNSVSVIDISNPSSPRYVSFIIDNGSTLLSGLQKIHIDGNRAYVTSGSGNAVQVLDIIGLETPTANVGSLVASNINVLQSLNIAGHLTAASGLNVSESLNVQGNFSVGSSTRSLFHVDTTRGTVFVATSTRSEAGTVWQNYSMVVGSGGSNDYILFDSGVTTTGRLVVGKPSSYHAGFNVGSITIQGQYYNNSTQNNDYAETVNTSEAVEPGDVLSIDPENPRAFKRSRKAYDSLAGGVVSTYPAFLITASNGLSEQNAPLALAGRTLTKVTIQNGFIQAGDLLVTSDVVGHAMKACGEIDCSNIGIVGVALENFSGTSTSTLGLIEILVRDSGNVESQSPQNQQQNGANPNFNSGQAGMLHPSSGDFDIPADRNLDIVVLTAVTVHTVELVVKEAATFEGTLVVRGSSTFEDDVIFGAHTYYSPDQAGSIIVSAGATSTEVIFDKPYKTVPKIFISSNQFFDGKYVVSKKTKKSFVLEIAEILSEDISFDWVAIALETEEEIPVVQETPEPVEEPDPVPEVSEEQQQAEEPIPEPDVGNEDEEIDEENIVDESVTPEEPTDVNTPEEKSSSEDIHIEPESNKEIAEESSEDLSDETINILGEDAILPEDEDGDSNQNE